LLKAVSATGTPVVLMLLNGSALAVNWANDHVPAILDAWYPGEAGGTAIARTLFGEDNPGGHLPYTVYASLEGVPPQNEYDVAKGYTYLYFKGLPLYPFGHGLSYTRFEYSHLKLSATPFASTGQVEIAFDITNTGQRAGSDVAQLYTHQQHSSVVQPIKSLRAFERVTLEPGESKHLKFELPAALLAYYDVRSKSFVIEPGTFKLLIGSSSEDIRLRGRFEVTTAPK
jgi:beta-glucosidase